MVLCLLHSSKSENTLIDTFNDIYSTCLVNLQTDCIQPKALEWFKRVIEKREIQITDDLTIVKNETAAIVDEESEQEDSARNSNVNLLSQVDAFLATHYLNIRYPKSVLAENVPAFLASTVNRMVPEGLQIPLEEGNPNEGKLFHRFSAFSKIKLNSISLLILSVGRGLVKKVLVPFLLGLKFKTTVLLPLAFALIALKAWKALTLGLISLVVSTAVVVFKLAKPKVSAFN